MGVRFECPNGHKLHVKAHLAGERGICPHCDSRFMVPAVSGGRVALSEEQTAAGIPTGGETEEKTKEAPPIPIETPPIETPQFETSINTSVIPPKPHHSSRRSRRERARRLTLILAAVIFVLTIVLIFVLRR